MAVYVDKVLKGAKPGELRVEIVTRYELIVNLKTVQGLGIIIPAAGAEMRRPRGPVVTCHLRS
jgi:ABC-type uncharacterized transport system substrate-binding protein